ncbi:YebG family protein (plasmid) [Aeromonas hydrophila]|uniref:YebG family protein n=1 Tax=Aeromonas hydrophila TaxID=644 RepID=UPI002ED6AAC6|nr:YebG family protein [Aeromonas hydrophila]
MILTKYVVVDSKGNEVATFTNAQEANAYDQKLTAMESILPILLTIPELGALDEKSQENIALALVDRKDELLKVLESSGKKPRKQREPRKQQPTSPPQAPESTDADK